VYFYCKMIQKSISQSKRQIYIAHVKPKIAGAPVTTRHAEKPGLKARFKTLSINVAIFQFGWKITVIVTYYVYRYVY